MIAHINQAIGRMAYSRSADCHRLRPEIGAAQECQSAENRQRRGKPRPFVFRTFATLVCSLVLAANSDAQTLEQSLSAKSPQSLFRAAMQSGSAARGAILFHGAMLGCSKCHSVSNNGPDSLGPNLVSITKIGTAETSSLSEEQIGAHWIESILNPSAQVAADYRALRVLTEEGKVIVGIALPSEQPDTIRLRSLETLHELEIAVADIAQQERSSLSIMPQGLVNALPNTADFLDLIRYLHEIHLGGEKRARELQPSAAQLVIQLPEYEKDIDHAGIIRGWDKAALKRGEAIYNSLCVNCHGTHSAAGSLATALRFADGKFKYGHDPYSIYQTLTRGAGLMLPQPWMVPQQKYDVIYYLREAYLKQNPANAAVELDDNYLAALPTGSQVGPAPQKIEPWAIADYGPRLINTFEIGSGGRNIAQKGIAVQLDGNPGGVAHGQAWAIFDHDTMRLAGVWSSRGFIDWQGIHFNGKHGIHPHIVGDILLANPTGPGWAHPQSGSLADDARVLGRDNRQYGPLPRDWARFEGIAQQGRKTTIQYRVGETAIKENFSWLAAEKYSLPNSAGVFVRRLELGPRSLPLEVVVATLSDDRDSWNLAEGIAVSASSGTEANKSQGHLFVGTTGDVAGLQWLPRDEVLVLQIPASSKTSTISMWSTSSSATAAEVSKQVVASTADMESTAAESSTAEVLFPQVIETEVQLGKSNNGFAVDTLQVPKSNPSQARVRLSGLDFYQAPDRMAVCTWDGDVWEVSGLSAIAGNPGSNGIDSKSPVPPTLDSVKIKWRRIAFGLFQPLGLKIIDETIYLTCRDQLVRLEDQDKDGAIDFYRCVNNDHQVTEHFHEFAMGLQTDAAGNFYYAKSARHALTAVVPHHGTLLRISPDGQRTDILATGFRAANGVCLNPDGTFIVTDQEGHWNPKNRINWVHEGGFYGNMFGYHDVVDESDAAMEQPLCWITNKFDRSPAELLWVDSPQWGMLNGSLLNLSYGYGRIYVVPSEKTAKGIQGGMCQLPIADLPTGIVRGRFSPHDRQLYVCGLSAWATNQTAEDGGLYRIRATGGPAALPIGLHIVPTGIKIQFSEPLGATTSLEPKHHSIEVWDLLRSKKYGSDHINQRALTISAVRLSADRQTLELDVPDIAPTWGMEIRLNVIDADGQAVERILHNTIHSTNE